jgi:predicted ABC-class ATPase
MTDLEFERRIEKDLLLRKINQTAIEDKSQVSDDEVKRYYDEAKSKFVLPESIHLKNIVVKVEPGKEDEAKTRIDEVHEKLKARPDFYEMAYKLKF